jgi:hypothetical protein
LVLSVVLISNVAPTAVIGIVPVGNVHEYV